MKRLAIALLAVIPVSALVALGFYTYPLFFAQPPVITYAQPVQQPDTIKLNADTIFELVNAERVKNGLQPLIRDARLDATAKERVDDMVARNYYSHYDPIDGHKMIDDQNAGCVQSENISMDWRTDEQVVSGWMGSKSHHDAILNAEYDITGVAVNGDKIVQHFCTR